MQFIELRSSDPRENVISTLAIVLGRARAEKLISDAEAVVEARAGAGAKRAVMPIVIGSAALGLLGAALGTIAFIRTRRR